MKLSVSLPEEDVAVLDRYVEALGLPSRSAGVQQALRLLRGRDLERDYEAAWEEWEASGDLQAWESAAGDGLSDASR